MVRRRHRRQRRLGQAPLRARYSWEEGVTGREIRVFVPVSEAVRSRNIDFQLTPTRLRVGVKGTPPIIEDDLWGEVDVQECTWFIEQHGGRRCVAITLQKLEWDSWRFLSRQEAARATRGRLWTTAAVCTAAVWLGWGVMRAAFAASFGSFAT